MTVRHFRAIFAVLIGTFALPALLVSLATFATLTATSTPSKAAAAEGPGDYTLTRQYGSVLFRVLHQDYLNLVGRFDDFAGTLYLDPDNMANSRLDATVQMGSLNMRDTDVSETLVSSSVWFNTGLYPEATFKTTSVTVTGENEADFHGELTFVGMSRPWTLHLQFFGGTDGKLEGSTVGILATGSFDRRDFGLDQYRNMAADIVEIEVNAKFNRD